MLFYSILGAGIWLGRTVQKISCGACGNVVAFKSGAGLIIQVNFIELMCSLVALTYLKNEIILKLVYIINAVLCMRKEEDQKEQHPALSFLSLF